MSFLKSLFVFSALVMGTIGTMNLLKADSTDSSHMKHHGQGQYARACGIIESRDGDTLKVKSPKGKIKEFVLSPETLVTSKGTNLTPSDVKPGQAVKMLRYKKSDRHILRIELGS